MLRINDSMTHFKRSKELENSMNRLFLETNPSFLLFTDTGGVSKTRFENLNRTLNGEKIHS